MGKIIVINGADFSDNALAKVTPSYNLKIKKTKNGVQFMEYQGVCAIRQVAQASTYVNYMKLLVADVRNLNGKVVQITTATPVVEGAFYCAFTSSLGGIDFNDIPELQYGSTAVNMEVPKVGDAFNVSETDKVKDTVTKLIPTGAKYLLVTIRTDTGMSEGEANVVVKSN